MSQKKLKKQRKLQNTITESLKLRTANIVGELCKQTNKDFETLQPLEKLRFYEIAKAKAISEMNRVIEKTFREEV